MSSLFKDRAKDCFYQKDYPKALELFLKDEYYYGAGLCCLLLKDTKNAKKYWMAGKKNCPACSFGLCVLNLIQLKPVIMPSFFQTRAQLEIYLNLFIENNLIEYAENMISCSDFLYKANPESYKFIARALYANGYFKMAIQFCKKTLKLYYCDPEAFLILAQCYFLTGELGEAIDCINRTLEMVPAYFPAILLKDILSKEIEKKYKK